MSTNKAVIELLCIHLKVLLDINIQPEQFRFAKFNDSKENCVSLLWQILYKICSEVVNCIISYEDDVVTFVKLHFSFLKYESLEFYCLPVDMSNGSRELLLAFGWLLATEHVLEKMTRKKIMQSPISMEFGNGIPNQMHNTEAHSKPKKEDSDYILWLAGKIRHNVKDIAETDQERVKLVAQVHEASVNSCGLPHLSVGDTRLVRDPHLLSASLSRLKEDAALVDTHRHWLKKSHVFWEWMETVIVKKEESKKAMIIGAAEKKELILFMNILRRKLKSYIYSAKKTENYDAKSDGFDVPETQVGIEFQNQSPDSVCSMPRYLLQRKGKEPTEVEKWLLESDMQLQKLEEQFQIRSIDANCKLKHLAKEMEPVYALRKNFC